MHLLELMKIKLNGPIQNKLKKESDHLESMNLESNKFEFNENDSSINETYLERSIGSNYNNNNNCRNLNDSISELMSTTSGLKAPGCNDDDVTLRANDDVSVSQIRGLSNGAEIPLSQICQLLKTKILKWLLFVCVRFVNLFLPPIQPTKSEKIAYLKKWVLLIVLKNLKTFKEFLSFDLKILIFLWFYFLNQGWSQ